MIKSILALFMSIISALTLMTGGAVQEPKAKVDTASVSATATEKKITSEQALNIALKDAGFKKSEVWDKETELDYERGVLVYEVSFEKHNIDYEYIINAQSGKILFSEVDPY